MNLLDLAIKITCDDKASEPVSALSSALKSGLTTAAGAAVAGVAAVSTATGALVGASLNAYSSYEQLVGGVDKLYGSASGKLQQYAAEAYKTAGMSANQYMEQATSFSAALVSSLGGDVEKAADLTDVAMRAMSDNVNVFGSNMADVQNAFQGFAKQNYTMLDNLKLGYGGTQEEMKRLVQDASELTDVQAELGLTVDGNSMSFDNIVKAIQVMQTEMGIAGTTTAEASQTIEGSITMMKAAWDNWVTGLANPDADMDALTDQLLESISAVADNVIPVVQRIGSTIVEHLPDALSGIAETLGPVLAEGLAAAWNLATEAFAAMGIELPQIDAAQITGAFQGVMDALAQFADTVGPVVQPVLDGIKGAFEWFVQNLPVLAPVIAGAVGGFMAFQAISGIVGIVTALSTAFAAIGGVAGIVSTAITVIGAAFAFLTSPVTLAAAAIGAVIAIIVALATNAGGCRDMVVDAFQAMCDFIGQLPGIIGGFISSIIDAIVQWASDMAAKAGEAAEGFFDAIQSGFENVVNFFTELPGKILNALGDLGSLLWDAGTSIINGLWEGMKSAVGGLFDWVGGIAGKIASLKGPLPYDARLLIPNGKAIMSSLQKGLRAGWPMIEDELAKITDDIAGFAIDPELDVKPIPKGDADARNGGKVDVTNNYNFYNPVKSPYETARAIKLQQAYGLAGAR